MRQQRGLSLVELMTGIAVGLFIVATASTAMSRQLDDSRRLLLETQVEQDLRATVDLIERDLRRSGYWQHASAQIDALGAAANAYSEVAAGNVDTPSATIRYAYSQDAAGAENDVVDGNEQAGLKLDGGVLKLLTGGGWQSLTDPATVRISAFRLGMETQSLDLAAYCPAPCPVLPDGTTGDCPPSQQVRDVTIELSGTAARDASVQRTLSTRVRLRNDRVVGHCGAA